MLFSTQLERVGMWPTALFQIWTASALLLVAYTLTVAIYNLFFHSLKKFPGPKVAAASQIPNVYSMFFGTRSSNLRKLHDMYGPIVRIAPNELSFTDSSAWKPIHSHRPFQKNFDMYYNRIPGRPHNILVADDADHSRIRRIMGKAFTEMALKDQEPVVQSYIDLLIKRLHEQVKNNAIGEVDIRQWYDWTIFDIVGDLALGEPFTCLAGGEKHRRWSAMNYDGLKAFVYINASKRFPPLDRILRALVPKWLIEQKRQQYRTESDKVDERVSKDTQRPDFMTQILQHNNEKGMSREDMHANASLLITAGNDTSATLLSGMTYLLVKSPSILGKLSAEIRNAFQSESQICIETTKDLQYLSAVIQESFRLYPPIPEALARVVPREGSTLCGHYIKGGTFVQISPYAANRSAANFTDPDAFIPERWIDPAFDSDDKKVLNPYSTGARNCIGYKLANAMMRIIMCKLLVNFDLELCEVSDDWMNQRTFIMWDRQALMVTLKPVALSTSGV